MLVSPHVSRLFTLALFLSCACLSRAFSQESVTIPKSRLEELERKEAELEKLKDATPKPSPPVQNSAPQKQEEPVPIQNPPHATAAPPTQPLTPAVSLTSLPPLEKETVVPAADLASHFRTDPAAADRRYRKHTFQVRGEIAGFEKPLLVRDYAILLKAAEPQTRVACDFYPPDKFKAVFAANSGTELVGLLPDGSRVTLAKVGDTVLIEGRCKGLSGISVKLTDCQLKSH